MFNRRSFISYVLFTFIVMAFVFFPTPTGINLFGGKETKGAMIDTKVDTKEVNIRKVKKYIKSTWGITKYSDDVISLALNEGYGGVIPYKDWIDLFMNADNIYKLIDGNKDPKAILWAYKKMSNAALKWALDYAGLGGVGLSTTVNLAHAPIQYGLTSFIKNVIKKTKYITVI